MQDKTITLRLSAFLLILITLVISLPVHADAPSADRAEEIADGILAFQMNKAETVDVQAWMNGVLTNDAGGSAENYVIALVQSGDDYDFSSYRSALAVAIEKKMDTKSASSMLKLALANLAVGGDEELSSSLLDRYAGELGIMSWVYALHLLNNAVESQSYTVDSAIDKLLELRLADGGWALTGQYSDVDVTALTIQSLAPSYQRRNDVRKAVDEALDKLSSMQLTDGGFQSYGAPNPESAAQVLIALSCLGIDGLTDERFIKDGTIFDSIEGFTLEDGSFCHLVDGEYNAMATQQVFCAMIAYRLQSPFYLFEAHENITSGETLDTEVSSETTDVDVSETLTSIESEAEVTEQGSGTLSSEKGETFSLKLIICVGIAGIFLIICVIFFALKKRNFKNFIIILLAAALLILLVNSLDIALPAQYYDAVEKKENVIGSVTLSISCERLVELGESSAYIPTDGILLESCKFDLAEGESAYDITVEAARKFGIQIDANTANDYEMVYVKGIGYLYEFDYGQLSGWIYQVNGVSPSVGCGAYKLNDGDVIEWRYTVDLGNDLK